MARNLHTKASRKTAAEEEVADDLTGRRKGMRTRAADKTERAATAAAPVESTQRPSKSLFRKIEQRHLPVKIFIQ